MSGAKRPGPSREQLRELKTLRAYELATAKSVKGVEMSDCFRSDHPTIEERRLLEDIKTAMGIVADQHDEIISLRAKLSHAYDIGHFSTCTKCGMPMRPGCICEACGWDRTEERGDE